MHTTITNQLIMPGTAIGVVTWCTEQIVPLNVAVSQDKWQDGYQKPPESLTLGDF